MIQSRANRIPKKPVESADRFDGALLISFLDGTTAMYDADFLYEHRNDNGNRTLRDDADYNEGS